MRRKLAVLGVVAGILLIGGVAYASIPGPTGVINGCRKISNPAQGALIVIDSAANCPSGYAALDWNQTGPQGPAGVDGANGVSGYEVVSNSFTVEIGATAADSSVEVFCSTGKKALGGGGVAPSDQDASVVWVLSRSYPILDAGAAIGWRVQVHRFGPVPTTLGSVTGYAICAAVS
jgi:hypothetical protein